jgi:uncharacterized protein (PEP-CTERM system associated)
MRCLAGERFSARDRAARFRPAHLWWLALASGGLVQAQNVPGTGVGLGGPAGTLGLPAVSDVRSGTKDRTFSARASSTLTITDNVNLAPAAQARSDVVLGLSVPILLRRQGPRVNLGVDYTPTAFLYADSRESDNVQNNLRSLLTAEAVDNFFFVEASASIVQRYLSPFLPRPDSGVGTTSNRTEQVTLGLSPFVRHQTGTGWKYLLRNDNLWTTYSGSSLPDSTTNRVVATADSPLARVRYGFDYTFIYSRDDSSPLRYSQHVARVRPMWMATHAFGLGVRLGYESNDYGTQYSGAVYGIGVNWGPSPRTKLEGFLEHRFFGASYGLNLDHRSRRTVFRLNASRNAFTTALQPFALRPGTTSEIVDEALRSRVPDPVQREQQVREFLDRGGLPPTLTEPYTFYTNQVYVAEQVRASVALVGRRSLADLTLFWQQNEPITLSGDPLAGVFATSNRFRQRSASLTLSHRVTPLSSIALVGIRTYAESSIPDAPAAARSKSTQDTVRLSLTRQLSPDTNASVGLRWASFDGDTLTYREQAVLLALAHTF